MNLESITYIAEWMQGNVTILNEAKQDSTKVSEMELTYTKESQS